MKRFCIDDETIMDYLEGRLNPRVRNQVEKHLCDCVDCRELVLTGAELLHEGEHVITEPVSPAVTERAIEAVKTVCNKKHDWKRRIISSGRRLISECRSLLNDISGSIRISAGPVPEPAPLRGSGKTAADGFIHEIIPFSDFQALATIEKTSEIHSTIEVELSTDKPLVAPLRIGLFAEENEIASVTFLDDPVKFEDIPNGKYTLRFLQSGRQLNEYSFKL